MKASILLTLAIFCYYLCGISSLFPVAPTLEHRACVKRFVTLQLLNPKTVGRTPWTGDQPTASYAALAYSK
jgi:hypothetical protein